MAKKRGVAEGVYEWAESVAFAVVAVVLVFTFLFRVMGVDGSSMEPTLMDEDFVLISDLFYSPRNGDIVVIAPVTDLDVPIVKRVIATGGQTVDINFTSGAITVDGAPLAEPYVPEPTHISHDVTFPAEVPEGSLFILGDNRNNSLDSRDSSVGMVDERYVLGRVLLRILPLGELGPVH